MENFQEKPKKIRKPRTFQGTLVDITGRVYGERTVLRRAGASARGMTLWTCRCSCGKIDNVDGAALRKGLANKCSRAHMIGKRVGKLTVLSPAPSPKGKQMSYWNCLCDCGSSTVVQQSLLTHRLRPTESCGCLVRLNSRRTHGESGGSDRSATKGSTRWKLLVGAKARSKKYGLPFDLELDDVVVPSHCPILGILLKRSEGQCTGSSPTLDKIIPALGYVKGNVWVISFRANTMKSDATTEEIGLLYKAMKKRDKMIEEASRVRLNSLFGPR